MPQPIGRDLEQTGRSLCKWLEARLPEAEALRVSGLRGPKDTGFSSDTLMFVLHRRECGVSRSSELVLRLEPSGDFGLFPEYDASIQGREFFGRIWLEAHLAAPAIRVLFCSAPATRQNAQITLALSVRTDAKVRATKLGR